jgi:exosortase
MPQMETATSGTGLRESRLPATTVWPVAVVAVFFGILWWQAIAHLRSEWSFNPQYSYAWSVPFLALYLFWRRWPSRPGVVPPKRRFWPVAFIITCAFLLFPVRFVAEANPDWRLLSWNLALAVVAISFVVLFLSGGASWSRHFTFPLLFFLVAVPWPALLEQSITQSLMRAVTTVNVFLLNLAGIPALRLGNVIEVGTGLIGIEEACSGVRSFQATLMISLFLGELYSFSVARRVALVIAGALLAFLCNLVRTAILVWMGAQQGAGAIHAWHDPAGFSILLVTLFGLWAISLLMRRRSTPEGAAPRPENAPRAFQFPVALLISLGVWFLLVEGFVQVWYGMHQSPLASSRWGVRWPSSETAYRTVPIAPEAETLLRYNEGGGAMWKSPEGQDWMMYFFRWLPGRTAALFVKTHRPDICLPASGMKLVSDNGIRLMDVNGANLPVRSYRFEHNGQPLHVYYCYWDARSSYEDTKTAVEEDWTPRGRVRAALRGRRELGAQMLEVAVWGYEDDSAADAALHRQLGEIVARG